MATPSASTRRKPDSTRINYLDHMYRLFALLGAFASFSANAQVYPTNWWTGMHYSKPELMIHLKDIGNAASVSVSYPGVTITDWHHVENHNYLFLHLMISPSAKPGRMEIHVQEKKGDSVKDVVVVYTLLPR